MKTKSTLLLALLATLTMQVAQAQAPAKPARPVNRDELRVCMNSELQIGEKNKALAAQRTSNNNESTAIRAEAQALAEEEKAVDSANDRKVREFKQKVEAHNERVKAANAARAAWSTEVDALAKTAAAYNEKCAGITYAPEDREAILKEREAGKK